MPLYSDGSNKDRNNVVSHQKKQSLTCTKILKKTMYMYSHLFYSNAIYDMIPWKLFRDGYSNNLKGNWYFLTNENARRTCNFVVSCYNCLWVLAFCIYDNKVIKQSQKSNWIGFGAMGHMEDMFAIYARRWGCKTLPPLTSA